MMMIIIINKNLLGTFQNSIKKRTLLSNQRDYDDYTDDDDYVNDHHHRWNSLCLALDQLFS